MKKLNIGILGSGRIGLIHAKNIIFQVKNANVIAIADPYMLEKTAHELEQMGIPFISKDIDAVINHKDVDAIIIGTPTFTHVDLIKKIIKSSKKPIFCEKPLSLDWRLIPNLLKDVNEVGAFVQMGYNRRFDINFGKVQEAVANNKIGKLYLIDIASFDPSPPSMEYLKNSGMMWTDMNIHDFDMMRFISGQEVEEIFAFGANLINSKLIDLDVDVTTINIKFKDGSLGIIRASRKSAYGYDQRVEVLGEKGRTKIENVRDSTFRIDTSVGRQMGNPVNFFMDRYSDAYRKEIEAFVDSIIFNKKPIVSIEDDLQASKMANACEISYRTGKPVKIKDLVY